MFYDNSLGFYSTVKPLHLVIIKQWEPDSCGIEPRYYSVFDVTLQR